MLAYCRAYVVSAGATQDRALTSLAQRVEFGDVRSVFRSEPLPADQRVTFFLVDYQLSEPSLRSIIASVRSNRQDVIRYAPIVLFLRDGPYQDMLRFIQLGFDDVIALPDKREELSSRLRAQLRDDIVYFETDTYLGPDRRRMEVPAEPVEYRRTGTTPHTKLFIERDSRAGVKVLRREIMGIPSQRRPSEPILAPQYGFFRQAAR